MKVDPVELLMLALELILCMVVAARSLCTVLAAQSPNDGSRR
jgi:hypothetical protein